MVAQIVEPVEKRNLSVAGREGTNGLWNYVQTVPLQLYVIADISSNPHAKSAAGQNHRNQGMKLTTKAQ